MYNDEWVTSLLLQEGKYPAKELDKRGGLTLKQEGGQLLLSGTACDLIDLADRSEERRVGKECRL